MKVEYVFTMRFVVEEKPGEEPPPVEAMREEFNREFADDGDVYESTFDATRTVL